MELIGTLDEQALWTDDRGAVEKSQAISLDDGKIMRLRFLGTNSEQGTCPAVYETDRDTYVVQGKLITDPTALADLVKLAPDETVVEIPKSLARFLTTE